MLRPTTRTSPRLLPTSSSRNVSTTSVTLRHSSVLPLVSKHYIIYIIYIKNIAVRTLLFSNIGPRNPGSFRPYVVLTKFSPASAFMGTHEHAFMSACSLQLFGDAGAPFNCPSSRFQSVLETRLLLLCAVVRSKHSQLHVIVASVVRLSIDKASMVQATVGE